jgi:peptidoglycan-N-acetylglucosamine deacetylase
VRVALTFDTEHPARPCPPGVEERLLETLAAAGVRATFFLQGRWTLASPDVARRIAEAGHLIGNHSHFHAPMDALTDSGFRLDVRRAEETIRAVTGVDPRPWFRCPFGAGAADPVVLERLAELGYRNVGWDVSPQDWQEDRSAEQVEALVLDGVAAADGDAIVVLHSWPAATAGALPGIVERLALAGADLFYVTEIAPLTSPA